MKYLKKISIRVVIALLIGFLLASASTKINNVCKPIDGAVGCVSFDKAIMHPSDLLNNKQGSLSDFIVTMMVAAALSFSALTVIYLVNKKPKSKTDNEE